MSTFSNFKIGFEIIEKGLWFFRILKYRILIGAILAILTGLLDGLGIITFLPLLTNGSVVSQGFDFFGSKFNALKSFNFLESIVLVIIIFSFKGLIKYLNLVFRYKLLYRLLSFVRNNILKKLTQINYVKYLKLDRGLIQNVLSTETERLQYAFTYYSQTLEFFIVFSVYIIIALIINTQFTLLVSGVSFVMNFTLRIIYQRTYLLSQDFSNRNNRFQKSLNNFLNTFKYVRSSGRVGQFLFGLLLDISRIEDSRLKIGKTNSIIESVREPFLVVIICSGLFIEQIYFNTNVEELVIVLIIMYRALTSLTLVQTSWNNFNTVSGSLMNITKFEERLIIKGRSKNSMIFEKLNNSIQFVDVSLTIENKKILQNISFEINKNSFLGIIGPSGSGKSSLLNLLTGLIQPTRGSIVINGKDLNSFNLESYQRQIGYLTQESVVFQGSVFDNVSLWDNRSTDNEDLVIKALTDSSFFSSEQQNPSSVLDFDASTLSGGQKQRLSIARELYKNVDILIFDEGTSALDNRNRDIILENLKLLRGKLTLVMVTHDEDSLKFCDKIIKMRKGELSNSI